MVRLRAPEPSDIDVFMRWENDSRVWECGSSLAPLSHRQMERYLENYSGDIAGEGQLRLVVECLADGSAVGAVDLFEADMLNCRCGMGIIIDPDAREKGYAREALDLTADYARRRLGFHQLWCHVASDNNASRRLFTAAGFTVAGSLRDWLRRRNAFVDVDIMQLIL